MRLLVATPLYPPDIGGPATYAKLLEEGLPELGIQVAIAKFGAVRRYPKIVRHIAYFILLLRAGRDADVLYALDPVSTGFPTALAAKVLRKPFAVKIVGDYAWEQGKQRFGVHQPLDEFVRTTQRSPGVVFFQKVQLWVARQARVVLVPSEYLKGIVGLWGIPLEHVRVVFNAVSIVKPGIVPDSAALSRPRIVSVGRLVPWKGMGGIIDAMVKVREKFPAASLTIAGDGPDKKDLERYASARLKSAFTFTGALPHEDVLALLREADVFAINSSYEGLSHLLIEAQMIGTPTVATNVGGNPEVISNGENGLLVTSGDREELADAITTLAENTEVAAAFHVRAKEQSVRFSVKAMLDGTKRVLETCV
ncbi:glycosyltransferase family 4 protein [Patescibacteria group bacterium]|nr:glycosyltransferase family 4 protein [Patescibacteria group bacterium]MBU1501129.1 glycosyltransferase family 4 protein [Patescibacteria group bacterium]MBU2080998.1 glycosyltransferase family 4 protein [Patescibacteria group bacterium]MBU2124090.1 glycosyltransferase family 4 protein [Patescibacteria group bacterium]MBU2194945.1 glycosyltransferase family 4 protein [Patescibacteria group bacterium]